MKLLDAEGVDFQRVDYYRVPFTTASLSRLLDLAALTPRDVLRKRAPQFAELGLADESVSDEDVLSALVEHPDLLQRPLVERGGRAVLARPAEVVRILL